MRGNRAILTALIPAIFVFALLIGHRFAQEQALIGRGVMRSGRSTAA